MPMCSPRRPVSRADLIVTGDRGLLDLRQVGGSRVVSLSGPQDLAGVTIPGIVSKKGLSSLSALSDAVDNRNARRCIRVTLGKGSSLGREPGLSMEPDSPR